MVRHHLHHPCCMLQFWDRRVRLFPSPALGHSTGHVSLQNVGLTDSPKSSQYEKACPPSPKPHERERHYETSAPHSFTLSLALAHITASIAAIAHSRSHKKTEMEVNIDGNEPYPCEDCYMIAMRKELLACTVCCKKYIHRKCIGSDLNLHGAVHSSWTCFECRTRTKDCGGAREKPLVKEVVIPKKGGGKGEGKEPVECVGKEEKKLMQYPASGAKRAGGPKIDSEPSQKHGKMEASGACQKLPPKEFDGPGTRKYLENTSRIEGRAMKEATTTLENAIDEGQAIFKNEVEKGIGYLKDGVRAAVLQHRKDQAEREAKKRSKDRV